MLEELFKRGNQGEEELTKSLRTHGYEVKDVSSNPCYWDKDIDLIATNLTTGKVSSIEVKWDKRMAATGNMFIEMENPRSKGGLGWFSFCEADLLAYGDAVNKVFYFFRVNALKDYINKNKLNLNSRVTSDGSYGYLLPVSATAALIECAVEL